MFISENETITESMEAFLLHIDKLSIVQKNHKQKHK